MNEDRPEITPDTKVAALLDSYPELEEPLIAMARPFKKLRNPLLRNSVARVASLRQAAAAGSLPVKDMVNTLRAAVGQAPLDLEGVRAGLDYFGPQPPWLDRNRVAETINESTDVPEGKMAITHVLRRLNGLPEGETLLLVSDFLPAPGIDLMRAKRFETWSEEVSSEIFHTFFHKPRI